MATIAGTIRDCTLLSKTFHGTGAREVWQIAVDFAAYTLGTDDASLVGIGAAINATARSGGTRTLRWGACGQPGRDTNGQAVYFGGASVNACTVSSDDLTGDLNDAAVAEITTTAVSGMQMIVAVDVS